MDKNGNFIDYHWYRQNPNGSWSHKPGWGDVTNKDASGKIINDPTKCNRDYRNFAGPNYNIVVGIYEVGPSK